jgi:RNA polymerase sigma-70 factor (ECF subfamily)
VINEALGRVRAAQRRRANLELNAVVDLREHRENLMRGSLQEGLPDAELARRQVRQMLATAIDDLPEPFRLVFVLREVEGLSIEGTAAALDLPPTTVKSARRRLQRSLAPELESALTGSFPFGAANCAAMTA